ncbi:hypothetical protein KUCAC02_025958 [Chaenocephalus aceratus]|uniref:Uncharacterized protein n=1 Tax=Chaenocephalus aceratus TaxID=36190 RepID=A0ACB9VWU8_CHAAC|nr:hypothetical protein KUCAC02_025958 [Chaenocephalus aceratus]
MSGRISGVQAKLKEQCPSALYVHCSNHALDLVLQEVVREVRVVADTFNFVRSVLSGGRGVIKAQDAVPVHVW